MLTSKRNSSTILVVNLEGPTKNVIFVFVLETGLASWRPLTKSREGRNWADSQPNVSGFNVLQILYHENGVLVNPELLAYLKEK